VAMKHQEGKSNSLHLQIGRNDLIALLFQRWSKED